MKKSVSIFLATLLVAVTLVACGGAPGPDVAPDPIPDTTPGPGVDPNPDTDPIPDPPPFVALENGQAAAFVIGQDDLTSTAENSDEKRFQGVYGTPVVVGDLLYLPDPGLERVMGYQAVPTSSGTVADFVLGKEDFTDSGGPTSAVQLDGPHTVFTDDTDLFVVDHEQHRIVRYDGFPITSGAAGVFAIGQPDLYSDGYGCSATQFFYPESAAIAEGRLVVADSANNRVLIWDSVPTAVDTSVNMVLGQPHLHTCDHPSDPTIYTLSYPTDVWTDGTRLLVVDSGHNRVLLWNTFPTMHGEAPDIVIGQANWISDDPGDAADEFDYPRYLTSNGTQIAVSDTGNNRVLIWNEFPTVDGTPADVVLGQSDFGLSDENGGANGPTATGFNNPTGILFHDNFLYVGDHNNDRYFVFEGQ